MQDFNRELHARPSIYFAAPALVTHVAAMGPATATSATDIRAVETRRLKIAEETHSESPSRTVVLELDGASTAWPDREDDEIVAPDAIMRVQILALNAADLGSSSPPEFLRQFGIVNPAASVVGGGDATVFSDFRTSKDGFNRIVIINERLNAYRLGRMVRRLYEIETYRAMALLGLAQARETSALLPGFDQRMTKLSEESVGSLHSRPREILDHLSDLASELSQTMARVSHRFGATRAYADIVEERIRELREEHFPGHQRFGTFVDRRFRPAVRTCISTERRLQQLSTNVGQLIGLLQTRVQVDLEEQNLRLLQGMDARTATQIKIQKAVEGLSIIAITYYAAGLVKLSLESIEAAGLAHTKSWMIVALPLTALVTISAVLAIRHSLTHGR